MIDCVDAWLLESADGAAARVSAARPDAVLVVQTMAVPPALICDALSQARHVAVMVWAVRGERSVSDAVNHAGITRDGATVGASQLLNVLQRLRQPHSLFIGPIDDESAVEAVCAQLQVLAAATRLKRLRVARVGPPLQGYSCVDVDNAKLACALGVDVISLPARELQDAYRQTSVADGRIVANECAGTFSIAPELAMQTGFSRCMRFAAALEQLDERLQVGAGTLNCHVPELRFADDPGIAPCYALGRETSRGIPWTCTGDVLTAIAMWTTKSLSGSALYHEIEALDDVTKEAVLANSGEHDLAWCAPDERPELLRNGWFATDRCTGVCACFSVAPGPATLVGFTEHADEPSGFRFIVAEGFVTDRRFPGTGTAHGAFRFGDGTESIASAWARWAASGVNHHSSAARGHIGGRVAELARLCRIGCVRIT